MRRPTLARRVRRSPRAVTGAQAEPAWQATIAPAMEMPGIRCSSAVEVSYVKSSSRLLLRTTGLSEVKSLRGIDGDLLNSSRLVRKVSRFAVTTPSKHPISRSEEIVCRFPKVGECYAPGPCRDRGRPRASTIAGRIGVPPKVPFGLG